MSGLIDSLSNAANALNAQRLGIDVAGQNVANLNTAGYARRTVTLAEHAVPGTSYGTGGVDIVAVRALRDQFVEARIQLEQNGLSYDGAVSSSLSVVQAAFGRPGSSVDGSVSALFDAFSALAGDPTSTPNRDQVVSRAKAVAQSFADIASSLESAQQMADGQVRSAVEQVNGLSAQIARLNHDIQLAGTSEAAEAMKDQRQQAMNQLADLIGANVTQNNDGTISVTAGQGRPLVIGTTAFTLDLSKATTGLTTILTEGIDRTSEFAGGQIGGYLHVRDTLVPNYQSQLDQFAYDLSSSINAIHAAGYDQSGANGNNLFVPLTQVAGAASSLTVDPTVAADSSKVAASGTGSIGDNGTARALAALRDGAIGSGSSTSAQTWAQLVYRVGADSADAETSQTTRQQIMNQLGRLRDAASGVNIDEEAANLMKFQRAYEANARYFMTISNVLETLIAMVQ